MAITIMQDSPLIDSIKFYNGNNLVSLRYNIYIQDGETTTVVHDYENQCVSTGNQLVNGTVIKKCNDVQTGTHVEKNPKWKSYNIGDSLSAGDYTVKITGNKPLTETIDWIITSQGQDITDLAYWSTVTPAGYWKFNELSGGNALDTATSINNLTAVGNPTWLAGKLGNALNVTYSGGFNSMTSPNSSNYTFGTADLTVCGWFNVLGGVGTQSRIFVDNFGDGNWANNNGWGLTVVSSLGGVVQVAGNGATLGSTGVTGLNDSTWHRVCWVRTGTNNQIYVNNTNYANFTNGNNFNIISPLKINGQGASGGETTTMKGSIDDLVIYKGYAFTPAQVNTDWNNNAGIEQDMIPGVFVTLSYPGSGTTTNNANVQFVASITTADITNASLWTNESGVMAIVNVSTGLSGATYTANWTRKITPDGSYLWNIQACDASGLCGFGLNSTFTIDTIPPSISIINPTSIVPYGYIGENISLNYSISNDAQACWFNYNNTNTTIPCQSNASFVLAIPKTLTLYANDSAGNVNLSVRSWTYPLFFNSQTYNLQTYETASEIFTLNISGMTSASLNYAGSSYPSTISNEVATKTLDVPVIGSNNNTFYWTINGIQNTTSINQTVLNANLTLCGQGGGNVQFFNFTFKDETTLLSINATTDSAVGTYYLGSGTVTKSLVFQNSTLNPNYAFCFTPPDKTLNLALNYKYSSPGYPQRTSVFNTQYTNATTNQGLYLLSSASGIYVTFQAINGLNNPIPGVTVVATRVINGVTYIVEQGVTDSSGLVTFWLNNNFVHTITASGSGYVSTTLTITPTQSSYSIIMSSTGGQSAVFNSSLEGIYWSYTPAVGQLPTGLVNFGFILTDTNYDLISCKEEITDVNGTVVYGVTTGVTNSSSCSLILPINLVSGARYKGRYSMWTTTTGGYVLLDRDAYWYLYDINVSQGATLSAFLTNLKNLPEFGADSNRAEYSRIVFFFFALMILVGIITFFTGVDGINQGASIIIAFILFAMAGAVGWFKLNTVYDLAGSNSPFLRSYLIVIMAAMLSISFYLNYLRRNTN